MSARKGSNPNHPKLGSITKVDPIRDLKAIARIKAILAGNPRDLALFTLGINTAFRASDLVSIRVSDLVENRITIREQKTAKVRTVLLNAPTLATVRELISVKHLHANSYLFLGQRGQLSVPYVNGLVKRWCRDVGIKGNYGSHSLRKTFGYHMRTAFNVDLPTLMTVFNHSSQRQTMTYLGIQEQEVLDCYSNAL